MALRDTILACADIPQEVVEVLQWKCKILVKGLTGFQRDEFERMMIPDDKASDKTIHLRNTRARLISICCYDPETGARLFNSTDIESLGTKSAQALTVLFKKARELSGMNDDLEEEAKK